MILEKRSGVFEQSRVVVLQDGHDVLAPLAAEVDERGLQVGAVGDHGVEEPAVGLHQAFEQTLGGAHFVLARPQHFHAQRHEEIKPDEPADDALVVVLRHRVLMDADRSRPARGAGAVVRGKKTRARP